MFAIERQMIIKEMLINNKSVDVSQLSKMFDVSEITIRRDFDKLEKDGILIKTYGGAILNSGSIEKITPVNDNNEKSDAVEIAKIALSMIYNDEVVFLGSGKISEAIASRLENRSNLTVITNDIFVASKLYNKIGITVKVTGGDLRPGTGTLMGYSAISYVQSIFIGKAFLSVKGVHTDYGYTLDNMEDLNLYNEIKKRTRQTIITSESSKFDNVSLSHFADISDFDIVITNSDIPDLYKEFYFNNKIKIFTTHNL